MAWTAWPGGGVGLNWVLREGGLIGWLPWMCQDFGRSLGTALSWVEVLYGGKDCWFIYRVVLWLIGYCHKWSGCLFICVCYCQ